MTRYRASLALALTLGTVLGTPLPACGGTDPPAWLVAASKVPTPETAHNAPAVELLRECRLRVTANGTFVTTTRRAIRVLTREGREAAVTREFYEAGSGSIQEMQAWMLKPGGGRIAYGKKEAIDASTVDDTQLYTESRVRAIVATEDAEVGSVYGSESVVEFRQDVLQFPWMFQERLPVVASRLVLTAPTGWNVRSVTFNHSPIEAGGEGDAKVWAASNLPYLMEENWSPPVTSLAPRVAVTLLPPASESRWPARFESWLSVARWMEALAEPQGVTTPEIAAKSRELIQGRSGEWERIDAIARYVQGLQYVSVQTGLARGGGHRPQAAREVFAKSYGDCKGKANLLRTMLRDVGVRSHLVLIAAYDPDYVREEWPSPYQFDHCILAIEVGASVAAPAVLEAGGLRLLIFDPTDSWTPLGQVPFDEQGSLALLVAGSSSALIRVPASKTADNGMERTVEGSVGGDGNLTARVLERALGREATRFRREYRGTTPAEYRKALEHWISEGVPGASISKLEVKDDFQENRFVVDVEFRAAGFARMLPGGLLVVKPLNLDGSKWRPRSAERHTPLLLPSSHVSETTVFRVPAGFEVEECSEPIRTETPFGAFRTSCELEGSTLRFRKELELNRAWIPPDEFPKATEFFDQLRSANQVSVVLAPATPPAPASSQ